ncbi:MAG: ASKHA domain-containing protein [Flexilinea sp.]
MKTNFTPDYKNHLIDWQPIGLKSACRADQTLLSAARKAGIQLVSFCGGNGTCGSCRVRLLEGTLSPLTDTEKEYLPAAEITSGIRLACQAYPLTDVKIHIPPSTLSTEQRLQLEGEEPFSDFPDTDRVIRSLNIFLNEPTILDSRADTARVKEALIQEGIKQPEINHSILHTISDDLRENHWKIQALLRENTVAAIFPQNISPLGLAVDIGTTKIAAYLIDLNTGHILSKKGAMNPQISYGEDIISRVAYTNLNVDGRDILQNCLIDTLNMMIGDLCKERNNDPAHIVEAVFVCNTVIHHLFCNLPVKQLGRYPFIAAVSESLNIPATNLGLHISQDATVFLPENIAGYVGADHVSMLIGTGVYHAFGTLIALDIGTNTEISLLHNGRIFCCSCASGPAFEGAHISCGMRASAGAIERIQIIDRELHYKTIGDQSPIGLCGSGILDIVAALKTAGAINPRGNFDPAFPLVRKAFRNFEYVIVSEEESATGNAITVTRADINEIILAKSAIRAGIEILMKSAGIQADDVEEFIVAGAFGTFLDINSAVSIGMFPDLAPDKFKQVGNAAGTGARGLLLSTTLRTECKKLAQRMEYVELSAYPNFNDILVSWMHL